MIDYFAIGLTHALLALVAWRLLLRADLDSDPGADPESADEEPVRGAGKGRRRG